MELSRANKTPANKQKDMHLNFAPVIYVLITVVITLLALTTNDPASAATRHRNPCAGSPLPRELCRLIREEAPHVKGAKVRWAYSRDLAVILRRESGFDWCAVNPGRHQCSYPGPNHSCGAFQRLPCVRRVYRSHRLQVRDGLRYIAGRYGTPRKARDHSDRHHWY